jgi:hypothetical protein
MNAFAAELTKTVDHFISITNNTLIDWERKPEPGKWSNKEIIGHLCDSAQINLQRFIRCTYEENFKLIYEQEEWVIAQHYQEMNVADLLQLWRLLNLQISRALSDYPADRWQARCDNSKNEVQLHTVEFLAQDYLDHFQHHLKQIRF